MTKIEIAHMIAGIVIGHAFYLLIMWPFLKKYYKKYMDDFEKWLTK